MTIMDGEVRALAKGAHVAMREIDAELGSVTVLLDARGTGERVIDADVSVLLLGPDGRVRSKRTRYASGRHSPAAAARQRVGLLSRLRAEPAILIPEDQLEIRAFTITLEMPMGSKRAASEGTLIHSVRTLTNSFYADVVQHLRPWAARG